ncbi:unnamed protein product [Kluyveromyces dobzhanskii CBS 2104]|uniref:WGS project CCBQ000000000 data, contig 00107 n=1 Tax=Kluyveromyces dobzhanskii CBS 2104 TaxID=1427455 RepID=A0A0A8L1A6_9SACH|nr:unnamed protein product [Kluyveromyces dobzhanskii CBS 2104]
MTFRSFGFLWTKIRRSRKFYSLVGLLLVMVCLGKLSGLLLGRSTSDSIIDRLHAKHAVDGSVEQFPWNGERICTEYFESLYAYDENWKIRGFFDQNTWFEPAQRIRESVRHLRLYGQCFLSNNATATALNSQDIENRLFPLLTRKLPIFTRWDGYSAEDIPKFDNDERDGEEYSSETKPDSGSFFWKKFKDGYRGRGIVVSLSDGVGVDEGKRLLRTLRLLGNALPIQFVHKGDLSEASIAELVDTGRGELSIEIDSKDYRVDHPQELWFVNAKRCLTEGSSALFRSFYNKWLASLFNSFEEMILMDTDTVPFVSPNKLFENKVYEANRALFFQDRPIREYTTKGSVRLYKGLMASDKELELFHFSNTSSLALRNPFFESRKKHVMESGLVTIDRSKHLPGLIMGAALHLWKMTSEPFHGDKELFWLGQLISGNDKYGFNSFPAGAIGQIQFSGKNMNTERICSTQLGHFDEDAQLLWVNSGLKTCKLASWAYDFSRNQVLKHTFGSVDKIEEHYLSPVNIDGAIVPNKLVAKGRQKLSRGIFKQNRDLGCNGYFWCAYNSLINPLGTTVRFNDDQVKLIRNIVKIWNIN